MLGNITVRVGENYGVDKGKKKGNVDVNNPEK
jgi:hypothetical protein